MLIPIFKSGDVLLSKNYPDEGKLLVLGSRTKSETTEYTTDMDIGCGVTRHEIKTSEWTEYDVLAKDFRFENVAEDDLLRWYRRIDHVDLPCNFIETDSGEKDEEIRKAKEAIEFYKDQLKDRRKDIRILQELGECTTGRIKFLIDINQSLNDKNNKLSKEVAELNDQLKMAYGCIDRFTIDAVAGMRRAGCSVEKIAKTLNMPEQAIKVYLNAADVLDCKEEE